MGTTSTLRPLRSKERHAGDPADALLAAFVADHYDRLVRLAWLVCRDGHDAGDAVQSALERAWRGRDALRNGESVRSWLDRIVVREAIRLSGRRSVFRRFHLPESSADEGSWRTSTADEPSRWMDIGPAFERLPPDQRAVIVLHLYAGYSVAETAALVGAPIETARTRLRRGLAALRSDLGGVG